MRLLIFVSAICLFNCVSVNTTKPIQHFWKITDSLSNEFSIAGCKGLFYYDNSIVLSRRNNTVLIALPWDGRAGDVWNAKHFWKADTLHIETFQVSSMFTDMFSNGCAFDSVEIDFNKTIYLVTPKDPAAITDRKFLFLSVRKFGPSIPLHTT